MEKINDGGPAFPCQPLGPDGMPSHQMIEGLTIRDYFAVNASEEDIIDMQICKDPGMISRHTARYMYADAMIAQREGK